MSTSWVLLAKARPLPVCFYLWENRGPQRESAGGEEKAPLCAARLVSPGVTGRFGVRGEAHKAGARRLAGCWGRASVFPLLRCWKPTRTFFLSFFSLSLWSWLHSL